MPIYEYHCEECTEPFEVFVRSISAPVSAVCPHCGSEHVEKAVSAVSAVGGAESVGALSSSCAPSG
jgi:putative FmdB family regulatory protein